MRPQDFQANFHEIANAPGGVARLREVVLHLATSGRVVPQDLEEGNASAELKEIEHERTQAIEAGIANRSKPQPEVRASELDFVLPPNWVVARIADVVLEIQTGPFGSSLHKHDYQDGGTPVINPASLQGGAIVPISDMAVGAAVLERLSVFKLRAGDIVMARRGEMGRCAVVTDSEDGWLCGTGSLVLRMPKSCHAPYVAMLIGSPDSRRYLAGASVGTTMQNLNQSILAKMVFGLPPLAEQKRIVAKVEELMALCDALEAQQQERDRLFPHLSRATHTRLTDSPSQPHLNALFSDLLSVSPEDMKKTIVQFAMHGWLVERHESEGTGEALLSEVRHECLKAGAKDYGTIGPSDEPFPIPEHWIWARMGNLALASDSGWSPQCESTPRKGDQWGVLKVSAVSWDKFAADENKALPAGMEPRPECEVKDGDFLLSRANTEDLVARSVVVSNPPPRLMMSDKIVRFTLSEKVDKRFINLANSTAHARAHYARNASGTSSSMKNVGRNVMCNVPVPLPPLAEQRRIVAKVDELMALVDQLEAQQQEQHKLAEAFARASVSSLTAS